ncbi:YdiU family protein [Loktanella sp. F6476L]|uniref:protein adenylyltransferase SelO n=1 Tax=Loktanella sp. F6476L TaxID=2926405 RepID=UPI001FF5C2B7|nr:YdiU family protein [Loktanella sp. F6476L]MCK0121596.1 YdiU family protein [Loktanella sp. F6476L]
MKAHFDNSYSHLPANMFAEVTPTPVGNPHLIIRNDALAKDLGITFDDGDTAVFSGNTIPDGAAPLAQLYAGHQFGNWNPQLGDGRAVLLGEVVQNNQRFDIQLKGSGRTPFSRGGDGRAWLGPVLREYLVSEAMHALGVPTTRALAAVSTGEPVVRETVLPGAILTRVASSHIRVGTFQIYAARGDMDALKALTDYTIARHYPDATGPSDLLNAVIARQARLIAEWMGLGFIHGVMNTDNASIAGETIDYGPCAFMDSYHPERVFSAIDQFGRYAYQNQPQIATWNMAQFATSLIPLMDDRDAAIEEFTIAVNGFNDIFQVERRRVFGRKLGLSVMIEADDALASDLLDLMAADGADFTNVFANLDDARDQFLDRAAFDAWHDRWTKRRDAEPVNALIISRNHNVEAMITAAVSGDFAPFHALLAAVTDPFAPLTDATKGFANAPTEEEQVTRTFCGT